MNSAIVRTLKSLNDGILFEGFKALPQNADLSYVDFTDTKLRGVPFTRTFLIYTDFSNSDLDDAIFDDAYVRNAEFSGATLSNTKFS